MILKLSVPGQPVCDFSVSGTVVTVSGYAVDCAQFYEAGERVIEVRKNAAGETVIGGEGPYLATIVVPSRRYTDGENGQELAPLDPNAVAITLWPAA